MQEAPQDVGFEPENVPIGPVNGSVALYVRESDYLLLLRRYLESNERLDAIRRFKDEL